jgi:cytochrome c peroxidase
MTDATLTVAAATARPRAGARAAPAAPKLAVRALDFHYGDVQALRHVDLDMAERQVTA